MHYQKGLLGQEREKTLVLFLLRTQFWNYANLLQLGLTELCLDLKCANTIHFIAKKIYSIGIFAGIRIYIQYTSSDRKLAWLIHIIYSFKAKGNKCFLHKHNINLLTQQQASETLRDPYEVDKTVKVLLQERARLMLAFQELPICQQVFPTDANFFLARMSDAQKIYDYLVERGIIVRNRSRIQLCDNCLRITIGTRSENNELVAALRQF